MPRNREEADLFFCSVTPLQNVRNENYVGITLDFDTQLVLEKSEVPECQLEGEMAFGARLGWNTWLRSQEFDHDPDDAVFEGREVILITRNDGQSVSERVP